MTVAGLVLGFSVLSTPLAGAAGNGSGVQPPRLAVGGGTTGASRADSGDPPGDATPPSTRFADVATVTVEATRRTVGPDQALVPRPSASGPSAPGQSVLLPDATLLKPVFVDPSALAISLDLKASAAPRATPHPATRSSAPRPMARPTTSRPTARPTTRKPASVGASSTPAKPSARPPRPAVPEASAGKFLWPVAGGRISQRFGCTGFYLEPRNGDCAHFHFGIDMWAASGTPAMAAAGGTIVFAGWRSDAGDNEVWISIGNDLYLGYHHLSSVTVSAGETVARGQRIGSVGMTGLATGPHLHFEVWIGPVGAGRRVDPMAYF